MTDFARLLTALAHAEARFILVGGVAAAAHGATRLTQDIDVLYDRTAENIDRIVGALRPLNPYLRGAPPGLPFLWDCRTVEAGLNFTLTTDAGEIDLLGAITGGGSFADLEDHTTMLRLFGQDVLCSSFVRRCETWAHGRSLPSTAWNRG